jgi:hypothetical protein
MKILVLLIAIFFAGSVLLVSAAQDTATEGRPAAAVEAP